MVSLRDNDKAKPLGLRTNRGAKPQKTNCNEVSYFIKSLESSHKVGNFPINATGRAQALPLWGFTKVNKKMETNKKQRGGQRAGAGRKRIGAEPRKTLAVRVEPATLQKLEQLAQLTGKSKGQIIDYIVNKHL